LEVKYLAQPKKVKTKSYVLTATATSWNMKMGKFVIDEDCYLIGMSAGHCASAEGHVEFKASKGVSDPAVDLKWDDTYFVIGASAGAGGAGSGSGALGGSIFLPEGFGFYISEDEPIFLDLFARAIGDGGTVILYYVEKKDWK